MRILCCLFSYGGIEAPTNQSLVQELFLAARHQDMELFYALVTDDALISRSRSRSVARFLKTGADVLFFLDHDIEWRTGDLVATAAKAAEVNGVVGGIYSYRVFGAGYASRPKQGGSPFKPGEDRLIPAEYVAGGFTAYSKQAIERTISLLDPQSSEFDPNLSRECRLRCCEADIGEDDYWPLFAPLVVPSTVTPGKFTYLPEDWSGSHRFAEAGVPQFLWAKPVLRHWGRYPFSQQDGAGRRTDA